MTGNVLIDLLISITGVAVLVGVSWALGAFRTVKTDLAAAADRVAFDEPDFRPAEWLFDEGAAAAAALSEDGREVVFVFGVGDKLGSRRMRVGAVPVTLDGTSVSAQTGDVTRGRIRLRAPDADTAARWARRLSFPGDKIAQ